MNIDTIRTDGRIVIVVDPLTKETSIFNMTEFHADVKGVVDAQPNEDGECIVKIEIDFTFKGLACCEEVGSPPQE